MKHGNRVLSLLLTVCLLAGLLSGLTVGARADGFAANTLTQEQLETLVQRTAMAYFYKGSAVQYDASEISWGARYKSGTRRLTLNRDPEDASDLNAIYTVCSAFPHEVYYSIFGKHIITNDLTYGDGARYGDVRGQTPYTANDPVYNNIEGMRSTTGEYTYHAAMAAKYYRNQGQSGTDYDPTNVNRNTDVCDPSSPYADVVYYFGPEVEESGKIMLSATLKSGGTQQLYEQSGSTVKAVSSVRENAVDASGEALTLRDAYTTLGTVKTITLMSGSADDGDETATSYYPVGSYTDEVSGEAYYYVSTDDYKVGSASNTITSLTRADVENIFTNKLRPGDILIVLTAAGAEDENSSNGHAMMYLGDVDGDGLGEIIHSTGSGYNNEARTPAVASIPNSKNGVTEDTFANANTQDSYDGVPFTYGNDAALLAESGATTTGYLDGYDNREIVRSSYVYTSSNGNNDDGRSGTAFVGRNGGGSIVIEDWVTRLGYRMSFADASVKTADGSGLLPLLDSGYSGGYYPGNDGRWKPGTDTAFQFTVLRPLNKASFTAELSPSAQARRTMPDLGVATTASPNSYQTVASGDTITYSIELVGNKGRGTVASGRTTTTVASFNTTVDPTETYSVNVTETLPSGTAFVSCTGGGTCTGDTVAWNNVSVADGETKTLTYTVRVTAGRGSKIVSPKGKVVSATDPQGWLSTSEITHLVGGTPLSANAVSPAVTSTGHGTDIASAVYRAAYGIELDLPETDALFDNLFAYEYWANESSSKREKYRLRDASELSGDARLLREMVVQNYVGGRRVITYDENGIKSNRPRLRDFSMEFLRVGDILIYADREAATGYFASNGGELGTYVYVYLGNSTFAYYDESGNYQTIYAPLKLVRRNNSARYLYSAVLTRAFQQQGFVLLRPTQAVDDLAATGCDLNTLTTSAVATLKDSLDGETWGTETEFGTLTAALNYAYKEVERLGKTRQQEYIAGLRGDELTPLPYFEIKALQDDDLPSTVRLSGNTTLDLNGHTIRHSGKMHIGGVGYDESNYSAAEGIFTGPNPMMAGECRIKNGTIIGDYSTIYFAHKVKMYLDGCRIFACNTDPGNGYTPSSTPFYGQAIVKGSTMSMLYLNDCVIGSLGNECPVFIVGDNSDVHIQDNVTFYVPDGYVTHWVNPNNNKDRNTWDASGETMTVDGEGVTRSVTTETVTLPVDGATEKTYQVVRFSSGVASIDGVQYATLDAALTAAAGTPQTVTLLGDLVLSDDITIPAGVTVNPGGHTLTGGKLYLEPGATYDTVTVPTGANEVSLDNQTYDAFLPDTDMTVQQSLSLTDTIVLNAAVDDDGYTNYYAWMRWTEGGTAHAEVVTGQAKDGMIYFPLVGKKAKNMGDLHDVTIFAIDGEGKAHIARSTTLSVKVYADAVLDDYVDWTHDTNDEATGYPYGANLGRAMIAMLQYGAAAQTYFGYETSSLVDGSLKQEMKDRITAKYGADALAAARAERTSGVTGSHTELFYATSSILGENMALKFYFRLPPSTWTDAVLSDTTVKTEYTDHQGVKRENTFPATELVQNTNANFRSCTVDTLVAADITAPVTVTLTRGGVQLVQVRDSVANYTGRAAAAGMEAIADPMLIYGLAARDYFPYVAPAGDTPVADEAEELTILPMG